MDDESTVRGPQHFILLRRYGEEGTPEYDAWNSELPTLFPGKRVGFGNIYDAVDDARKAAFAGEEYELPLKVKVAPGTRLERGDVLALIEANPWPEYLFAKDSEEVDGGPEDLDLSHCDMDEIDLSPETIQRERDNYVSRKGDEPPWYSPAARQLYLAFSKFRKAEFRRARLEGAVFSGAHLQEAIFADAQLRGAELDEAHLEGTFLAGAHLEGATLRYSEFRDAFFRGAHLTGVDFRGARLENVDLFDVASARGVRWYGAFLHGTRMRREHLGAAIGDERAAKGLSAWPCKFAPEQTYWEAKEAYLMLKTNFNEIGRYEDAAWAYMKEQQMAKASYFPTTLGHQWLRRRTFTLMRLLNRKIGKFLPSAAFRLVYRVAAVIIHIRLFFGLCPVEIKRGVLVGHQYIWGPFEHIDRWRWLRNWTYELLTGYGERPLNPVIGGALAIVGFAAGYFFTGAIGNFWDAFVFSLATFATFNLVDIQPGGRGVDIASSVEALLGITVLALVVFTLGNRMSRS